MTPHAASVRERSATKRIFLNSRPPADESSRHQDEGAQIYPYEARHTRHRQQKQYGGGGGCPRTPDLPRDVTYRFYQFLAVLECRARAEHKGDVARSRELRVHAEFYTHKG